MRNNFIINVGILTITMALLVSTGCNTAREKDAQEVKELKAAVAVLERKMKWEELSPRMTAGTNPANIHSVGEGIVLKDEPRNAPPPKMNLSRSERLENFDFLAEAIDKNYSFFVYKNINWPEVAAQYRKKVGMAVTDDDFYLVLRRFVRELKDAHSWLCNYKHIPGRGGPYSPLMHTRLIEGKCVVTEVEEGSEAQSNGIFRGCVVLEVDGLPVEEKIEAIRPLLPMYSSERAFLEKAYREILNGERGTRVEIAFMNAAGLRATASLQRVDSRQEEIIKPSFNVTKGRFIWYGIDPSGCGYIRIRSFLGRMEIAEEFDAALEQMKDTPGLIIDVRDNGGGSGVSQLGIIGRFITSKTLVSKDYVRNGPWHGDFRESDDYCLPAGNWQYTKPVALLINSSTGSASDFFVCRFKSTARPIIIGTTTHGNLTGWAVYAQLPCNLVVRISNGYIRDLTGRNIEGNGTDPQIKVEATIKDIVNGTDPVIERAAKECIQ
jgi:carboxyl-terminal processing protease